MSELKPCPFCLETKLEQFVKQRSSLWTECPTCGAYAPDEDWNTRPIEDALNKRIAELEEWKLKAVAVLGKWEDVYELTHGCQLGESKSEHVKEFLQLQAQRIAELEDVIKRSLADMDKVDEVCRTAKVHPFTYLRQDLSDSLKLKEQGS